MKVALKRAVFSTAILIQLGFNMHIQSKLL